MTVPKISRETTIGVSFDSAVRVLADRPAEVLGGADARFTSEMFGLELGHTVRILPGELTTVDGPLQVAVLPFRVEADPDPDRFPVLVGEIELISTAECKVNVALEGEYHAPGGVVGSVIDRVGLHRIAEEAIDHFFSSVVDRLRRSGSAIDALTGVPV
jgi:hypothetical protein